LAGKPEKEHLLLMPESLFLGSTDIALSKWHCSNPAAVEPSLYLRFTLEGLNLQCYLWIAVAGWHERCYEPRKQNTCKVMIMCVGESINACFCCNNNIGQFWVFRATLRQGLENANVPA
jgi:hypothetical protein